MKYNCELCEYSTDDIGNFDKHRKSLKHVKKLEEKVATLLSCNNCGRVFKNASGLWKHKKICGDQEINLKESYEKKLNDREIYIIELEKDKQSLTEKVQELNKVIDILTNENDYHKDLVNSAGSIAKTSVNALSYVVKNFNNAPAIEKFSKYELLKIEENYTIREIIIYYQKNDNLSDFVGAVLIDVYKKEDPKDQSIWNTDTSRFAYVVREVINNKNEWAVDKGGLKVREYAINPMLNYIKVEMNEYVKEQALELTKPGANIMKIQANINIANSVVSAVENGTLANEIMKFITPSFYLNKTKAIKDS